MQVESYLGAIFICIFTAFFIGLLFIAMKNYNSDMSILNSEQARIRGISITEAVLIRDWVKENNIEIPEGKGFRYIIKKYPDKPWLSSAGE